jgi:hypothetical protein
MPSTPGAVALDRLDEVISFLEQDENRYYVELDLIHQLRDQLAQTINLTDTADE